MDNFKKLLDKQIMKAKSAVAPAERSAAENTAEAENAAEDKANISIRKAGQTKTPVAKTAEYAGKESQAGTQSDGTQSQKPTPVGKSNPGWNVNRITVNLFEADSRALAVIKERLSTAGYDFTNRSDSIKIGLRLAVKATPEELAKILEQVKSEDRRFKADDD